MESATKACQLTSYKDPGCLEALAHAHNVAGDTDAAIAAIDKAIALHKPSDKSVERLPVDAKSVPGELGE